MSRTKPDRRARLRGGRLNRAPKFFAVAISMAFIAPDLVKAAIEGSLPRGIGVANLREAPARSQQRAARTVLEARDRGHLRAFLVRQPSFWPPLIEVTYSFGDGIGASPGCTSDGAGA